MKRDKIQILGIDFDNVTLVEAVAGGLALLKEDGCHYVVTPNAEIVHLSMEDEELAPILNGADLVLPDGIGVVYASKILGHPLKSKVAGIDFAAALAAELALMGAPLFLLGAKPGVAATAAERMCAKNPGLVIAGTHDGYFKEDAPIVEKIKNSGAAVVFVCLGAPRQERWMKEHGAATGARLLAGLGGSLDVFAGVAERAPDVFINLGMEWFYRLLKQPSRIGRMMRIPKFLVAAVHARSKGMK